VLLLALPAATLAGLLLACSIRAGVDIFFIIVFLIFAFAVCAL
jgi:hypothetical protein